MSSTHGLVPSCPHFAVNVLFQEMKWKEVTLYSTFKPLWLAWSTERIPGNEAAYQQPTQREIHLGLGILRSPTHAQIPMGCLAPRRRE